MHEQKAHGQQCVYRIDKHGKQKKQKTQLAFAMHVGLAKRFKA
jgi:hypothetical protein